MEAVSGEVQQWRLRTLLSMSKLSKLSTARSCFKVVFFMLLLVVLFLQSSQNGCFVSRGFDWSYIFLRSVVHFLSDQIRGQIALKCRGPYNKPDVIKVQILTKSLERSKMTRWWQLKYF